jgi:hypothetical protein
LGGVIVEVTVQFESGHRVAFARNDENSIDSALPSIPKSFFVEEIFHLVEVGQLVYRVIWEGVQAGKPKGKCLKKGSLLL